MTSISCRPSSLIGDFKENCLRSIENPASFAASAASLGVTDPYNAPVSEADRIIVNFCPFKLTANASASFFVSKLWASNFAFSDSKAAIFDSDADFALP